VAGFPGRRFPEFVNKLILVGSGPFDSKYTDVIISTRLKRLSAEERAKALDLMNIRNGSISAVNSDSLSRLSELFTKTDNYDALPPEKEPDNQEISDEIFRGVWSEAEALRKSGRLLEMGKRIKCPVVAIHGDYDPHPAAGVREPLGRVLSDFKFILLPKCGHEPWLERFARNEFFRIIREEI
jgi:pimeloyl-ACP methyl ester carboxylesterase